MFGADTSPIEFWIASCAVLINKKSAAADTVRAARRLPYWEPAAAQVINVPRGDSPMGEPAAARVLSVTRGDSPF
jgi:hypothetical protein